MISEAEQREFMKKQLWDRFNDQLYGRLCDQLGTQVHHQLFGQLISQLWDQPYDQFGVQLCRQIWIELYSFKNELRRSELNKRNL